MKSIIASHKVIGGNPVTLVATAIPNYSITLGFLGKVSVVWGDGVVETYTNTTFANRTFSHTYSSAYTGSILIRGNVLGIKTISTSTNVSVSVAGVEFTKFKNLTSFICQNTAQNWGGTIAQLPRKLTVYNNTSSTTLSGNLSDMPLGMITLFCYGFNSITGNLSSLSTIPLTSFYVAGNNSITGNISSLPSTLINYFCYGVSTVIGDLSCFSLVGNLRNVTYFSSPHNLTGDISSLSNVAMTFFSCSGATITGNLSSLSILTVLNTFTIYGSQITGDINSLPNSLRTFTIQGTNTVYGAYHTSALRFCTNVNIQGNNNISGNTNITPSSLVVLIISSANNTLSSDLSYFSTKTTLTDFVYGGLGSVIGNLGNFPNSIKNATISGSNVAITGTLSQLTSKTVMQVCNISTTGTITGSINDLPISLYYISFQAITNLLSCIFTYTAGKTWANTLQRINFIPVFRSGNTGTMSSVEISNILIDVAPKTWTGEKYITLINNNPRDTSSNSAVTTLNTKSVIVQTQP